MTKEELEFQHNQVTELIKIELNLSDEEAEIVKGCLRRRVIARSRHLIHKSYRHKELFIAYEGIFMGTGYQKKKKRGIPVTYKAHWMSNKRGIIGDVSSIFHAGRAEEGLVAFKNSVVYSIAIKDLRNIGYKNTLNVRDSRRLL